MEGVVSILIRFVSVRSGLGAVGGGRRGTPLFTGGLLAGRPVGRPALQLAHVTVGTEQAGVGPGTGSACALWRSTPAPRSSRGGGGGFHWFGGGVQGRRPPFRFWRSAGWEGGGGEGGCCAAVVQSLCPPSASRFHLAAAAWGGSKAQAHALPTVRFPHVPRGGSASPGPCGSGAPADVGGHRSGPTAC